MVLNRCRYFSLRSLTELRNVTVIKDVTCYASWFIENKNCHRIHYCFRNGLWVQNSFSNVFITKHSYHMNAKIGVDEGNLRWWVKLWHANYMDSNWCRYTFWNSCGVFVSIENISKSQISRLCVHVCACLRSQLLPGLRDCKYLPHPVGALITAWTGLC